MEPSPASRPLDAESPAVAPPARGGVSGPAGEPGSARTVEPVEPALARGAEHVEHVEVVEHVEIGEHVEVGEVGDVGEEDPLGALLLAAATAEFAERGYAGARVAEIARRAGVTTGAIYSRYRGKAELLAAALSQAASGELDSLFADHRFEGRMEDIILIAGSHLVDRSDSPAPGMLLESFAAARHEPEVAALLRAGMEDRRLRLVDIVDAAKAGGGIDRSLDTDALVTFCHAVGLGFLLLEVIDPPLPAASDWEALIGRLVTAVHPDAVLPEVVLPDAILPDAALPGADRGRPG